MQSKGLSRVFSNTTVQKHQLFGAQFSSQVQISHLYMTTGKTIALTRRTFLGKVMSLLFNMLSRLVITFLPRSKRLLISKRLPGSPQAQVESLVSLLIIGWRQPMGRLSMNSMMDLTAAVGTTGPSCSLQSEIRRVCTHDSRSRVLMCKDPESLLPISPVC